MLRGKPKKRNTLASFYPAAGLFCRQAIFPAGVSNFCVRDGYRCVHSAIATGSAEDVPSKPDNSFYRFLSFHLRCVLLVIKPSTY